MRVVRARGLYEVELGAGERFELDGLIVSVERVTGQRAVITLDTPLKGQGSPSTAERPPQSDSTSHPVRPGTIRALVREYIEANAEFVRQELIDEVQRVRPGTAVATLASEISSCKSRGEVRQVGSGKFVSLIARRPASGTASRRDATDSAAVKTAGGDQTAAAGLSEEDLADIFGSVDTEEEGTAPQIDDDFEDPFATS